jgi:hypothetical protein
VEIIYLDTRNVRAAIDIEENILVLNQDISTTLLIWQQKWKEGCSNDMDGIPREWSIPNLRRIAYKSHAQSNCHRTVGISHTVPLTHLVETS